MPESVARLRIPKAVGGHIEKAVVAKAARTLRYNWDDVIYFL